MKLVLTKKGVVWVDGEKVGKLKKKKIELDAGDHEIKAKFGSNVLSIVRECSDCEPKAGETKPPWKERKQAYLDSLSKKSPSALLVTACDKLHNLTAIVRDYRQLGDAVWDRFNSDVDENCWYYSEMTSRLNTFGIAPAEELSVKYAEFLGMVETEKKPHGI